MTPSATARNPSSRAVALLSGAALWFAPILFLLALYRDGLRSWFIADDFAWLTLLRRYRAPADLLPLLFHPAAQGTIRPWSERGFFLLLGSLFGLDDLPFRIVAFAFMAANLLLLAWLTRRITGSPVAGCIAAIVWTANASLVTALSWSSAFNQILCPFFLLAALALFVRFAETGRSVFWWGQVAVFVLGFGVLEINIVYPALAAAWTLFIAPFPRRRRLLWTLLPLFGLSAVYYLLHRAVVPLPATGIYALHFDGRILPTLALYLKWSLLPSGWWAFGYSSLLGKAVLCIGAAALLFLFFAEARRRRVTVLFFAAWYLATLAPTLLLPDHQTDYYLTIPLAGFAMLAAWGLHAAWQSRSHAARAIAVLALLAYLGGMVPAAAAGTRWWCNRTTAVRALVLGVVAARHSHPEQTILLDGVSSDLYAASLGQGALYAAHVDAVYLTPFSDRSISGGPNLSDPKTATLDPALALHALRREQVVVYSLAGDHLRNITAAYGRSESDRFRAMSPLANPLPAVVDVGNPLCAWLLGPSWLPAESGVRWMPGQATLRMAGPKPGDKLLLEGFFLEEQLKQGSRHLKVVLDGTTLGETEIRTPEANFRRQFPLPASLLGRDAVEFEIRVSPVTRKDGQNYGAVFGKFALQQ